MSFEFRSRLALGAWLILVLSTSAAAAEQETPQELSLLEAIRQMFEHDPNIAIAFSSVRSARGSEIGAAGRFDPLLSASIDSTESRDSGETGAAVRSSTLDARVDLGVEMRTGAEISSSLSTRRTDAGGLGVVDRGRVSFTLRQPLLRGRGRRVTTAEEAASGFAADAAELDLRQTASRRIRAVAASYWRLRAAVENLEVLRESEERSRELLATTGKLIEADRLPRAELLQLRANLALKETARIQGENTVFVARQELGREIGLRPQAVLALPPPGDPFPSASLDEVETIEPLTDFALSRRADVAASRLRESASNARLLAAENALSPQLDLILTPNYVGRSTAGSLSGFFSSIIDDIPGLSTTVSLSFSWPSRNRSAVGSFLIAQEVESRLKLETELLVNDLETDLAIAVDDLVSSVHELDRAEASAELFEQTARNEETKLRAGTSTLIDVINQQDRFTLSRFSVVSARLRFALAVIEARFQTGSVLVDDASSFTVTHETLTTVPEVPWQNP